MEQELKAFSQYYDLVIEFFVTYSFQVIGAIIIFILGLLVARWFASLVRKLCEKNDVDITLTLFLASCIKLLILAMVIIVCLGKFGISVAPFVAAIGAISLSAGLALQGVFSNYGAGFTIILTRPFVVGNTITVNGYSGIVEEIKLAYTQLTNEDGERITIPNKHIVGEAIVNSFENKIVEGEIGINYNSDIDQAIEIIQEQLISVELVSKTPAPMVGISEFADSSVNIAYRYWVPSQNYFELQYKVNKLIFAAFKDHNIDIPFPQREVKIIDTPS